MFDIDPTIETTTATITENQDDFYKITLEVQMQQYDDEQYAAEDREEDAARPKSEWETLAAVMDSSLFEILVITNTTARKK